MNTQLPNQGSRELYVHNNMFELVILDERYPPRTFQIQCSKK